MPSGGPGGLPGQVVGAAAGVHGAGAVDDQPENLELLTAILTDEGFEVTLAADGVAALDAGEDITYVGPSGIGPLNDQNDPSSAYIGIYEYGGDNTYTYSKQIEGTTE